jgi:hypothetical protein
MQLVNLVREFTIHAYKSYGDVSGGVSAKAQQSSLFI